MYQLEPQDAPRLVGVAAIVQIPSGIPVNCTLGSSFVPPYSKVRPKQSGPKEILLTDNPLEQSRFAGQGMLKRNEMGKGRKDHCHQGSKICLNDFQVCHSIHPLPL
jgi:hypothetical protein